MASVADSRLTRCLVLAAILLPMLALRGLLPWYRIHTAATAIEQAGGSVYREPVRPEWMRRILGERLTQFFEPVVDVKLPARLGTTSRVLDPTPLLLQLREFPGLRRLHAQWLPLDDYHLQYLSRLTRLEEIDLANTLITSDGIHHLERLPRLKILSLAGTEVDDIGLECVSQITSLQMLILDGTGITDRGIIHLTRLKNLTEISLSNTAITDATLELLGRRLPDLAVSDD